MKSWGIFKPVPHSHMAGVSRSSVGAAHFKGGARSLVFSLLCLRTCPALEFETPAVASSSPCRTPAVPGCLESCPRILCPFRNQPDTKCRCRELTRWVFTRPLGRVSSREQRLRVSLMPPEGEGYAPGRGRAARGFALQGRRRCVRVQACALSDRGRPSAPRQPPGSSPQMCPRPGSPSRAAPRAHGPLFPCRSETQSSGAKLSFLGSSK